MGDDMDYSSPEQQREAVRAKFRDKLTGKTAMEEEQSKSPRVRPTGTNGAPKGHPYWPPKTAEAKQRQVEGGLRTTDAYRSSLTPEKIRERSSAAGSSNAGYPAPRIGSAPSMEPSYKSFAKKIRGITNDGWELVDIVHTILRDSFEEKQYDRAINAATWLADRGFGKPVQVTALTDAEGNPVAFQLWQPAANEQGDSAEEPPLVITQYAKPNLDLSAPPTSAEKQPDRFALGPARIWGVEDKEPGPGE